VAGALVAGFVVGAVCMLAQQITETAPTATARMRLARLAIPIDTSRI
jgi:hypothetical protein